MYRDRFTKIVATLGPASSSRERLRALFEAGADVFRLNFSHGTQDDHRQRVDLLRALEKEYKHPIAILMDLPLFWDQALLARGVHKLRFHRDVPSRFAVLPRRGSEVRWFEAEPTYIYHVVNAWEEGDEIVLDAFRVVDPLPQGDPADGPLARMLAVLRLDARLHRWRFDLRTGATREEPLGELNTEFPTIDASRQGVATRYAYSPRIAAGEKTLLFDAIVKYDTRTGRTWTHELGPGRFASEAPFAARPGARDEDDGWLVSFVHDAGRDRSELWVLDARDLAAPPVARVALPQRVPIGFHACWVGADRLGEASRVAQV